MSAFSHFNPNGRVKIRQKRGAGSGGLIDLLRATRIHFINLTPFTAMSLLRKIAALFCVFSLALSVNCCYEGALYF